MSIIHEALKKVQAQSAPQAQEEKHVKRVTQDLRFYIIYLVVALLGFLAANAIFSFFTKPQNRISPPAYKPLIAQEAKLAPTPVQTRVAVKEAAPSLTLNGIFFSGQQGYALINNQIVREGEKVEGATVIRISLEGVELNYGGSAINLYSQGK